MTAQVTSVVALSPVTVTGMLSSAFELLRYGSKLLFVESSHDYHVRLVRVLGTS
jgi:hypothetical protein